MNNSLFQLLCETFPQIDVRLIKATALEHGDNVELALNFLKSESEITSDKPGKTEQTSRKDEQIVLESVIDSHTADISVITSLMDSVEDAKADKDAVMKLIEEISILRAKADKESVAAQEAKTQALEASKDVLTNVESMQKVISMKQEKNWVRKSEIYGEKAVLASEARELRLRLGKMRQQKENAAAILDEIKTTLEERLRTAQREKEVAEEEKKVRMEEAQKLLEIENARMAAVIEETENLEKEAEACTQMKEFLIDSGNIVDCLQGEMCVLYEDVDLFKKQVEEGTWFSLSTASLSSRVNPEGPYSFRRFSFSTSTASSQDLGHSLEGGFSSRKPSMSLTISSAHGSEICCHNNLNATANDGCLSSNNLEDYVVGPKRSSLSLVSFDSINSFGSHSLKSSEIETKLGCDVSGAGDDVLHYYTMDGGTCSGAEHSAEHTAEQLAKHIHRYSDGENSAASVSKSDEDWNVISAKTL